MFGLSYFTVNKPYLWPKYFVWQINLMFNLLVLVQFVVARRTKNIFIPTFPTNLKMKLENIIKKTAHQFQIHNIYCTSFRKKHVERNHLRWMSSQMDRIASIVHWTAHHHHHLGIRQWWEYLTMAVAADFLSLQTFCRYLAIKTLKTESLIHTFYSWCIVHIVGSSCRY